MLKLDDLPAPVVVDLGTIPDWVAAIGGIITAIIALVLLRQGMTDRRTSRRAIERDQAERIQVETPYFVRAGQHMTATGLPGLEWDVDEQTRIMNQSSDVINDLVATFHDVDDDGHLLPAVETLIHPRLTPGSGWTAQRTRIADLPPSGGPVPWVAIVAFNDANDVRWHIDARHQLHRGDPNLPIG